MINNGPLVSVLVPVFNAESFLATALDSILKQTHANLEIICLDDGSEDNSYTLLLRYQTKDPRITVLRHESNLGLTRSRNDLLRRATGDYISWLDADDWISSNKIEKQLAFLSQHPHVGAVGTGISRITLTGEPYAQEIYPTDPVLQRTDPNLCCASVLCTKLAVADAGQFREIFNKGGGDGDWLLRMGDRWDITNIPDILYHYRKNPTSASHLNKSEIRRLGVIARWATQIRRITGECPIDAGAIGAYPDFLSDRWFLDNQTLTPAEKLTATSIPYPQADPLISVLIVYQGSSTHLLKSLQSLKESTYHNFEACIYDDAAAVPIDTIIKTPASAEFGCPLKMHRSAERRGDAYARQQCMTLARGRFICFLNAGDQMHRDRLTIQLEYLLGKPLVAGVGCGVKFLSTGGIPLWVEAYTERAVQQGQIHGCYTTFMFRREPYQAVLAVEATHAMPSPTEWLLSLSAYGELHNVSPILYSCRLQRDDRSGQFSRQATPLSYKINYYAQQYGLRRIEDSIPFVATLDGTQIGEELLITYWRCHRHTPGGAWVLIKAILLLPKSSIKIAIKQARITQNEIYHHLTTAFRSSKRYLIDNPPDFLGIKPQVVRKRLRMALGLPSDEILVRVHDTWGDVQEALDFLLPNHSRRWGSVRFFTDDLLFRKPDYHLILNQPRSGITLTHDPSKILFAIGEPPTESHQYLHRGQGSNTTVFTSDEHIASLYQSERTYILAPCMTRTWSVKKSYADLLSMPAIPKIKKLSWVTSNLSWLPGHRRRLAFLDRLQKEVPFDLFGRGFNELNDKWDGLAPYEYSIAYENTIANYYFTEKLMDCLVAQAIPLYIGSPNIHRFFPEKSVIVIDPDSPRATRQILDILNFDDRQARRAALEEAKHLVLDEYNIFARVARYIENDNSTKHPVETLHFAPIENN